MLATLGLLLGPAAIVYWSGFRAEAHYVAIGSVLALQLSVLARPAAAFAFLLPAVYAAAAITAQSTDAVVALVVAIAAAVGAASSKGLHRGLVALFAAALLGSFEPAQAMTVLERAGFLLAGSAYGFLLDFVMLRGTSFEARAVRPQTALSYACLVAALALASWFAARLGGFAHAWWLPLAVVAASEPVVVGSTRTALLRVAGAMCATLALVVFVDSFDAPWIRGVLLVATLVLAFAVVRRLGWTLAVLVTPVLVLLSSHGALHEPPLDYLLVSLAAFVPVLVFTCLGQWIFWSLNEDARRVIV